MSPSTRRPDAFMKTALALASRGRGSTSPNPMVGAVVVKDGYEIGMGYHRKAGEPHAEVVALEQAGENARGAELYVSLEPCCYHGRTPPCVDRIIDSGIKKIVAAMEDPNPRVNGKGFEQLREAGIKVEVGLCRQQAEHLNEIFVYHVTTGLPFLLLKAGMSLDGMIATRNRESKWITSPESREYSHRLRAEYDAVMVGVQTVVDDDPSLVARKEDLQIRANRRVILDSRLRTPPSSRVISGQEGEVIVLTTEASSVADRERLSKKGAIVEIVGEKSGRVDLTEGLKFLGSHGVTSVILEGGSETFASALETGLVNKVIVFIAPLLIGGRDAVPVIGGKGVGTLSAALELHNLRTFQFGRDVVVEGYLEVNTNRE